MAAGNWQAQWETAARVVARLVVRDGRIDWRELEFLERSVLRLARSGSA